jgi:hypothetical protein
MYRNEALMVWPNPSMTRWLVNDRRATTGDLRRIPIQQIVIHGLKIGGASFGWQWWQRDKVTGSISARVHVDEGKTTLVLSYVLNGASVTQFIRLDTSPCRFGGVRWFAFCPETGRRVGHLYIGGRGALSRHAYHLAFNSQREGAVDRMFRRRDKLFDRLKSSDPDMPLRPKGMHRKTYNRHLEGLWKEEKLFEDIMQAKYGLRV